MSGEERTAMFRLSTQVSGRLNCIQGSVAGQSFQLTAGTFVIGRQEGSDMHLAAEPGVSKVHAKILAEGKRYFLVDNESRNGTILNGEAVQRAELVDGAEIQICGCRLRFTQTGGPGAIDVPNPSVGAPPPDVTAPMPPPAMPPPATPPPAMSPPAMSPPAMFPPEMFPPAPQQSAPLLDVNALAASAAEMDLGSAVVAAAPPRGSIWPSFFAGLFMVLIFGGAAAGAVLFLDDDDHVSKGNAIASDVKNTGAKNEANASDNVASQGKLADAGKSETSGDAALKTAFVDGGSGLGSQKTQKAEGAEAGAAKKEVAAIDSPKEETADSDVKSAAIVKDEETPWVSIVFRAGKKTPIRATVGGRVKEITMKNGDSGRRGALIVQLVGSVKASEIATAKESVSTLESIAESSEGAMEALQEERARLRSLLAKQRGARIVLPQTGRVAGLTVNAGDKVRGRQVVGFVERPAGDPSVLLTSSKRIRAKQKIETKCSDGVRKVRVKRVKKKQGKSQRIFFEKGTVKRGCSTRAP
ncbi:MAG: FHA domain-containing protein [Deltaproteobacteria bacterium]|nr:FHA domain-containing protein [Deltaproteobacteria bacterium]